MSRRKMALFSFLGLLLLGLVGAYHWAYKTSTVATKPRITADSYSFSSPVYLKPKNANKKMVYLTFDDGPDGRWTPRILAILKKNNVRATFFVVGTAVEQRPDLLKAEVRAGDKIGNHTYDHVYREIYASPANYIASLEKNDAVLRKYGVVTYITRPPAGHHIPNEVIQWLKQHKMRSYMWNLAVGDGYTTAKDAHFIIQTTNGRLYNLKNKDSVIVLMHDGIKGIDPKSWNYSQMEITRESDIQALPEIIAQFKKKGYTFGVLQ